MSGVTTFNWDDDELPAGHGRLRDHRRHSTHYWKVTLPPRRIPAHIGSASTCTETTAVDFEGNEIAPITPVP